jgi:bifunctional N-acetylglucosamine-1-phosphate-uridyltransferase/glucosamine-1-phosphate-acetyltransferase GlmU-like protein
MIKKFGLFGYGGHAREVAAQMGRNDITFFVNDEYAEGLSKSISEFDPKKYLMMIAIANSKERKKIVELLPENTEYFTFIHPTALIMAQDISIGIGSFIGAHSIITTNVKIGNHVILNRGNHIGHDTNIGDYFSAMPGSIVSGNVNIGDCVYMGTNSSTKDYELIDSIEESRSLITSTQITSEFETETTITNNELVNSTKELIEKITKSLRTSS